MLNEPTLDKLKELRLGAFAEAWLAQQADPESASLGFDERFVRMWNYYFCYCEAAFLERSVSAGQFVWKKSRR